MFNEAQQRAINYFNGACLTLAGPGSGKTTVITMRIKKLIEEYGVNPSNILVITFTKMAANEMQERFNKLMDKKLSVTFGTFHAVYFTILKHAYNYSTQNIVRTEQQRAFIKRLLPKYQLEAEDENEFITDILGEISKVKNERIEPDMYYSINCPEDTFRNIYREYEEVLRKYRLIDFDDMLIYCLELLSKRKDILSAWQNKYQYILIDEFQDINKVQYDVIKLLAGKTSNLFVVGDDDQSIYGFRGAKPEIMLNFQKDYPKAEIIKLDVNYRSTSNIVNCAKNVIDNNHGRYYKNVRAANSNGKKVIVKEFADIYDENDYIINDIRKNLKNGYKYSDIAVLSRTNIGSRQIMSKLIEYSIPFVSKEVIPNLYEHWIAQNIFAYIKLAMGNRERSEFLKVMNKPTRYISREYVCDVLVDFEELRKLYSDKAWMLERLDEFEADLSIIKDMNPFAAINYIRRSIGYDCYLREYAKERRIEAQDLLSIIGEIQDNAREFNTYEEWFGYIKQYTQELKEQVNKSKDDSAAVNLCTMHGAKGLEYKVVYIIDANEGTIPYNKAVLDTEIEEERRMFYVAMTRAKEQLNILFADEKYNKKLEVSRFVSEISEKYAEIQML